MDRVPDLGGAHDREPVGQLGSVAQRAVQGGTDASGPPGVVEDPRCCAERGIVTDVLAVQARELRHPVASVVAVDRRAPHALACCSGA